MTSVQIGSLTLQGWASSGWVLQELIDWYSIPESKSDVRERPQADGAFGIARDFRKSAAFTVKGVYLSDDRAGVGAAKRALRAMAATTQPVVTVTDEDGSTSRVVSIRSIPISDDFGRNQFTFEVDMVAPDPNRYGTQLAPFTGLPVAGSGYVWPAVWPADWGSGGDPGRVIASNAGTSSTNPMLEVQGGLSGGFELVELSTGSYLRLERDIPATSTVFLNTRTGRAYLDIPANDISSFLTRRDWAGFSIPAGGSRTIQINALGVTSGTPRLTVRYAPAF